MEPKYLDLIAKDSTKHLSISTELPVFSSLETLENWLNEQISELLNHDFEGLINAMYRIDVEESKVMEVLDMRQSTSVSRQLTRLVIQRIFEKIKTRERFGS